MANISISGNVLSYDSFISTDLHEYLKGVPKGALFPQKLLKNLWFSNDFKGNRSKLICLSSLNMRSEILQNNSSHGMIRVGK